MSKVKYPKAAKQTTVNNLARQVEELSGTLENWLKCREERLNAQAKLLQSCRNSTDVKRYKDMGLLDFEGTSIRF
jgi:uncharacterized protein YaaR (DUF327 family)